MEPVFVFLAGEYRLRPAHAAALALYDVFCAPRAPARLRGVLNLLPPRDLRLAAAVRAIGAQMDASQPASALHDAAGVVRTAPYRNLFDPLIEALGTDASGLLRRLRVSYDPARTPEQNLPGGRMNSAQRHFVEKIWQPRVRPGLVAAGFWQIATIG
jgi:hypothetical protein